MISFDKYNWYRSSTDFRLFPEGDLVGVMSGGGRMAEEEGAGGEASTATRKPCASVNTLNTLVDGPASPSSRLPVTCYNMLYIFSVSLSFKLFV